MSMKILGIDPGTAIVGYSIIEINENVEYKLLDYGCIITDSKMSMPERLEKIYDDLDSIIKLYHPDEAAIEDLFFFKNQRTVIKVSQARGVINLVTRKNGLDIFDYTPLQVKMGITGYGRATKKEIQLMVQRILNLDEIPKPDDAADAIAIAITHINSTKNKMFKNIYTRMNTDNFKKKSLKDVKTKKISNKVSIDEYKQLMKNVKK